MTPQEIRNLINTYQYQSDYSDAYYIDWCWEVSSELINEVENNIINKPMLEKAEKMLELAGMVPAIQGKVDSLSSKVDKMKMISPDDYVECENCGVLVNKNKAQIFSSVEEKIGIGDYKLYFIIGGTQQFEKEAVLHYLCQHCDMKKFKKEHKY